MAKVMTSIKGHRLAIGSHTILKCFLSMRSKRMITIANRRFPFPNELFLETARSVDSCQICAVIASNDFDFLVCFCQVYQ